MSVEFNEHDHGKRVEVTAFGKLTREDYEVFVPRFEALIEKHGVINVLFVMRDFTGFDLWALWEDIKFEWKHFSDIGLLGMVGEGSGGWQAWMEKFCQPFTKSEVKYFELGEIDKAREWYRGDGGDGEGDSD